MGGYCAAGVSGAKAIMTMIPEPTQCQTLPYGTCGMLRFMPLGHHFADSR
jgi:hypothetical protein